MVGTQHESEGRMDRKHIALVLALIIFQFAFPVHALQTTKKVGVWSNLTTTRARVDFLENKERKEENQPDRVINVMGIKEGNVVADIGSGTGLYTFRLASKVGSSGKVYAVDVLEDMLTYVDAEMKKKGTRNVTLVKSTDSDPRLPENSCDKMLIVNTFPHIKERKPFLRKLRDSLKKGGEVAVISIDRAKRNKGEDTGAERVVIKEMTDAGFTLSRRFDFLKNHYFLVFK
jgi:cyclopropane fatty-acyl-phospholipid synthase-like methyltransferase